MRILYCFQYIKGTKKKANHNMATPLKLDEEIVSNTSKVLKRKQITTGLQVYRSDNYCFQYIKGTKKKANHNPVVNAKIKDLLFPIHQRY